MSWVVLTFDHKTPSWVQERLALYQKRLSYWLPVEHRCAQPSSHLPIAQAQQADYEKIAQHKQLSKSVVVVLDEDGQLISSEKLARLAQQWMELPHVVFVIGPSYGLSPLWQQRAQMTWSLSPLTLTHEYAQMIVFEQLYRALTILKGVPYHIA